LTLSSDWLFQVREFKQGKSLFDAGDEIRLLRQTAKLATRALVSAIRNRSDEQVRACVKIMANLEQVAPECRACIPIWAKPLWAWCCSRPQSIGVAAGYVKLLSTARSVR